MNQQQVMDELRQFIRTEFDIPASDREFTDDVHLFDYGYVDSFGAVKLIAFVEESFAVEVRQTDLIAHPMNTIREITGFVVRRHAGEI
jgi:methoxymalonate biosynthesis acyl carrier protein